MTEFKDCRISDDKKELYVECAVSPDAGGNAYISKVDLVYFSNLLSDGTTAVAEKAVSLYDDSEKQHHRKEFTKTVKVGEIEDTGAVFDRGLFYLIVTIGADDENDGHQDMAVIPDWKFIYDMGIPFVAHLSSRGFSKCAFPARLEEFVILWHALELAFRTFEYAQINRLWALLQRLAGKGEFISGGCGCNG